MPADDLGGLLMWLRHSLRRYDGDRLHRNPVRDVVEFVGFRQNVLDRLGFGYIVGDGNLLPGRRGNADLESSQDPYENQKSERKPH
jgi:hypothetical protein